MDPALQDFPPVELSGAQLPLNPVAHSRTGRLGRWARLLAVVGSAQVVVQGLAFLGGILVIRTLAPHEYALYTLANTLLGTMTLLADSGVSTAVMAQGGKVWQDRLGLGAVLITGMELRRKFAMFSLLVAVPILFGLLLNHEAGWMKALLVVAALIPAFFSALAGPLLEVGPKLAQDVAPLQKVHVLANAGRLILLGSTVVFPFAAVALLCAGAGQIWTNWRLRLLSSKYADLTVTPDPQVRGRILAVVRRMLPAAIYYCIAGQISIWLIAAFGSTAAVAEVGALGRLAMAINLVSAVVGTLVVPRFVRLPEQPGLLVTRFFAILGAIALLSAAIVGAVWLLPEPVLWLLGENYSGLTEELVLAVAGGCMGLLAGTAFALCAQRGHVLRPTFNVTVYLASLLLMLLFFDYSTVRGVLSYAIANHMIHFLVWSCYFVFMVSARQDGTRG